MTRTFLFIIISAIIISLLYFLLPEIHIFGYEVKKPDLISGIFDNAEDSNSINNSTDALQSDFNVDSMLINGDVHFSSDNSKTFIYNYSADTSVLFPKLFKALSKTEKTGSATRIAFLGDSMIEADLITMTLRYNLQKIFGGRGVGYMPATSITTQYRKSIYQSFGNWNTYTLVNKAGDNMGFAGSVFQPIVQSKNYIKDATKTNNLSWVLFKPNEKGLQYMNSISSLKVYYGQSNDASDNYITLDEKPGEIFPMNHTQIVNELTLNDSNKDLQSSKIYLHCSSPVDVYGFSIDSPSGVFVDNYSLRGNSGIPLISLNKDILKGLNSYFNYNLIVLQYGLNVADAEMKDVTWYKEKMLAVVKYFQELFPEADILIMSVNDKCYRKNGKYITEPVIPNIVDAQRETASESRVIFWNLYESMGGHNSMIKWVNNKPPLANKDYTHFNYDGAELLGKYFFGQIISNYKFYRNNNKK